MRPASRRRRGWLNDRRELGGAWAEKSPWYDATSLPACKLSPPIAAAVAAVLGLIVAMYSESLDRQAPGA